MERLGLRMAGFDGDTMHMARLWDSSRGSGRGGYSLEALSSERRQAALGSAARARRRSAPFLLPSQPLARMAVRCPGCHSPSHPSAGPARQLQATEP